MMEERERKLRKGKTILFAFLVGILASVSIIIASRAIESDKMTKQIIAESFGLNKPKQSEHTQEQVQKDDKWADFDKKFEDFDKKFENFDEKFKNF